MMCLKCCLREIGIGLGFCKLEAYDGFWYFVILEELCYGFYVFLLFFFSYVFDQEVPLFIEETSEACFHFG